MLLRSEGHCENPRCTGEPQDITDAERPILDVDHIQDLAQGVLGDLLLHLAGGLRNTSLTSWCDLSPRAEAVAALPARNT